MNASIRIFSIATTLVLGARSALADGQFCSNNGGSSAYVCVKWSQAVNPAPGTDFVFNFGDANNPDVQLRTGDGNWRVWSQVSMGDTTPDNMGDLTIDATVLSDSFTVKIVNDNTRGPGAVNVVSLVLKDADPNWTGFSEILSGSRISGNLTGDMEVVDNGFGGGSAAGFTIEGNATRDITLPHGAGFTIEGAYAPPTVAQQIDVGDITNGTMRIGSVAAAFVTVSSMSNGILQIDGDVAGVGVADGCIFVISTMASNSALRGAYTLAPGVETIELAVLLGGDLCKSCTLDFSNAKVDTTGILIGGGMKDLDGSLLAYEFLPQDPAVLVKDVSGDVTVTSDSAVEVTLTGDLASGGRIDIGGDSSGRITIEGDVHGDIDIGGDLASTITVGGKLGGRGRILVDGLGAGAISIGTETEAPSLIRMTQGLTSTISVNADGGAFHAGGSM